MTDMHVHVLLQKIKVLSLFSTLPLSQSLAHSLSLSPPSLSDSYLSLSTNKNTLHNNINVYDTITMIYYITYGYTYHLGLLAANCSLSCTTNKINLFDGTLHNSMKLQMHNFWLLVNAFFSYELINLRV